MQEAGDLLQLAPIGPLADRMLHEEFGAVRLWEEDLSWLRRHGERIAMVATSNRHGCDATLMSALPNLRAISSWGVGFETIDTGAAFARGIQVSNTPDVLDDCVADLAWGLMIAAARRIGVADRYVRNGEWQRLGEFPLAARVSGKRLGIVGLGRIGSAIARRGDGFSMQVRYHGRAPKAVSYGFEASLEALAAWSDFLVIACSGGPETHHLASERVIRALGPTGILVNIGRGAVVDQAALIRALEEGTIAGAGLDVLKGEPGAPAALRALENVVMTPHIGSATTETRVAMERLVVDNLRPSFARAAC